mmetsp:Transcript_24915/g.59989  ORF Transcript_24915/g.59989 Transcript_24915/m.59989 type:complete len:93 (-) Transcript_24915:122-400(-)
MRSSQPPTKKEPLFPDKEHDEDRHFHAFRHNNNDGSHVVNVSSEPNISVRVNREMIEKLHQKLFPRDQDDDESNRKVTYGMCQVIEEFNFFE